MTELVGASAPIYLDFVVPDVNASVARANAAGATGFCLLQFTGRGYDEIAQ